MNSIKYVCSLGGRCHTASMLKECMLKKASYPFDWIFSNLDMILHCLEDNFTIFLDKQYYLLDTKNFRQNHSFYSRNDLEPTFNHHNPLNDPDYNYFKRCCKRMENLLKKPELKLFITMFLNYKKMDEKLMNDLIVFNKKFSTFTTNYGILCIVHYVSNCNYHHFIKKDNIHFLELYTCSISNGKEFEKMEDNIYFYNIIQNTYHFDLNEIEIVQEIVLEEKEKEIIEEKEKEIVEDKDKEIIEEKEEKEVIKENLEEIKEILEDIKIILNEISIEEVISN